MQESIVLDFSNRADLLEFLEYASKQSVQIDVWDACALHLLGSAMLPLNQLLRGGKPVVQNSLQLPILMANKLLIDDPNEV